MTLAETVKHYQDLKNLTTQEFASQANLPVDTINKIRSGATQNPSMDTLKRMASALGCSIDQLADMPVSEFDTSKLLPNMQQDFGGIAADFCGTLNDADTIKLCGVSRNSYYKYKSELRGELCAVMSEKR